ncbi:MAG: hypothetical protein ACQEXJ_01375 [Myxococcota bacterium]
MRIRKGLAVFAAAALAVGFAACDSDDGDGNGGTEDVTTDNGGPDGVGGDVEDDTTPEPDTQDEDDTNGTPDVGPDVEEDVDTDPCDPNPCTAPPADGCNADESAILTYDAEGTCTPDGDSYSCDYGETSTDCEGTTVCTVSGGTPECVEPQGPPTEFAAESAFVSSLSFPAEGEECCFDFDDDGEVDNGIGGLLDSLAPLVGEDLDVNGLLAEQIEEGTIAILFEGAGYADDPMDFFMNGYFGTALTDWTANSAGEGEFEVDPASFDASGAPLISFPAQDDGGVLTTEESVFALSIPISDFGFTLNLTIQNAIIEGDVSVAGNGGLEVSNGKLGGLVPMSQLAAALNDVADGCTCLNIDGPAFELAAEDKLGCTAAAKAATPECEAADGDICTGIGDNLGIACTAIGVLKPDIDTDDTGKADHFSVGLQFEAVAATLVGLSAEEGAQ